MTRQVEVKICGNTRKEDVEHAIHSGANAIGFIVGFPSTPRNLDLDQAYRLLKDIPTSIDSVVVTNEYNRNLMRRIAEKLPITTIQLIGNTPYSQEIREIFPDIHLIKVVYAEPERLIQSALNFSKDYDNILIDTKTKDIPGGTGLTHNWSLSRKAVTTIHPTPVILAGGLTPQNVEDAVRIVQPHSVDVSSGVESTPGIKDHSKVETFIKLAKGVKI
ncbi:MAG: phosphoribosylanthranilate isomerase [Candidatus Poseidoniia archaeon]|nr:phosphoribosylanthranilate isomerase [Candidatus Poseidoniia archaeon]